jgi:hypothetical protein
MKTLKKPWITLFALVLILLCTVKHSAWVYLQISPFNFPAPWDWVYACVIVLALDIAVLIFAIHGRRITAGIYAGLIFLTNLLYYLPSTWWITEAKVLGMLIFAGMFSYAVFIFSELFVQDVEKDWKIRRKQSRKKSENLPETVQENFPASPEKKPKGSGKFSGDNPENLRKKKAYRLRKLSEETLSNEKKARFQREIAEIETLLKS